MGKKNKRKTLSGVTRKKKEEVSRVATPKESKVERKEERKERRKQGRKKGRKKERRLSPAQGTQGRRG